MTFRRTRLLMWFIALVLVAVLQVSPARAVGDTVVIAVPVGAELTEGADGDRIIFIGKSLGYGDAQSCASDPDPRSLQPVVLVDGGPGGRATRSDAVVVISINGTPSTDGLRNGSRVVDLTQREDCVVGGRPYYRYTGTLE